MVYPLNPTPPGGGRIFPVDDPTGSAKPFGFGASPFQVVQINLAVAHDSQEFSATGNVLWCVEASDNLAEITLKYNNQNAQGVPFLNGTFVRGIAFSSIFITSSAQVGKWLKLAYTVEGPNGLDVRNPAGNFSTISGNVTNTPVIPAVLTSNVDVVIGAGLTVLVAAANIARTEILVSNFATNTQKMRIGGATTALALGVELAPGGSISLNTQAAVYAFNPGAGAENLGVVEIT